MTKYIFTIRLLNGETNELGSIIYKDSRPKSNKACNRESERITPFLLNAVSEMEKWTALRTDFIKYESWM